MQTPVRVLIVDDHSAYAEALTILLGLDSRIEIVGTAQTSTQACQAIRDRAIDVVLMDVSLAGSDGFSLTQDILQVDPSVRVLMLSSFAPDEAGVGKRTAECGASAFLSKSSDTETIAAAVVEAAESRRDADRPCGPQGADRTGVDSKSRRSS